MSVTVSNLFSRQSSGQPQKRVREEVRDGLAVMAFSAAASSALAVALMLVVHFSN